MKILKSLLRFGGQTRAHCFLAAFSSIAGFSQVANAQLSWTLVPAPSASIHSPTQAMAAADWVSSTRNAQPVVRQLRLTTRSVPVPTNNIISQVPSQAGSSSAPTRSVEDLRQQLLITPLVKRLKPWPAPALSPGVPSAFTASWGDVFLSASVATPGKQRDGVVDGSWVAGFGLGDAAKYLAVEFDGGCGSIKNFCANGGFDVKVSRLLVNKSTSRLAVAGAWQNFAQWGNEGPQDNTYFGAFTYALPLRKADPRGFGQTLQFTAGVGNARYAPFTDTGGENQVGVFASAGVELTPYAGVSAGWSGRGVNAQLSFTPIRSVPITVNLLGVDLFDQNPAGTVGVLSISWGTNFRTASF